MADVAVKPRVEDLPQEALDYFENDELRARCFIEKYALWDLEDHLKETHPMQMWERVANALVVPEEDPQHWFEEFSWLLSDFRFVPGGRILHGAGSPRTVTLTNCLVGETIVHTDEGFRSLEELAAQGGHFRARINGKSRWARAWLTGFRETVIIQTREGYRAESTPDHRFRLAEGRWVQAQDLKPGDELALSHDERPFGEPQQDDVLRGYAAGLFVGDGTFAGTNFSVANVQLFESKAEAPIHAVAEHYGGTVLDYGNHLALNSRKWAEDLEDVGIVRGTKTVTDEVMKQSSEYIRGFLRGLFDADSHVAYKTSKNIVLAQSDLDLLRKVQVMLLGFDIRSAIRADDRAYIIGEFPSGSYRCRPVHRLAITGESVQKFQERIGFAHPGKAAKLRRAVESTRFTKDLWHAEVQNVWPSGRVAPVYDMTVQEAHAFSAGGLHAHNCYFTSVEEDSLEAIFEWCKKAARTYSFGGGNGVDIGVLRPQGTPVHNAARTSSGAVSFMELFSTTTGTIGQHGRRGALMITCPVDHPDIQAFIHVKGTDLRSVRYANVSVKVTDEFMQAVQEGKPFTLRFENAWTGRVEKEVDARELWDELIRSAHASAEPGIIFWDHVKQESPSEYLAEAAVAGTNPCGEQPLEHNGACTLGHVNLSAFIRDRFTKQAEVDWVGLERAVRLGVRFLDNVVEVNLPLHAHKEQSEQARLTRRIGLGVTGLGDMLAKLRIQYDSDKAIEFVDDLMARIRNWAYDASADLAQEKGPFPLFQAEPHLERPFVQRLPEDLREKIRKQGLRNVCILTVAPVGSGSVLTGTSSGVEPIFSLEYLRRSESLSKEWFEVEHPLVREYRKTTGNQDDDLPDFFVTSHQIDPFFRVKMQGTLQRYIDSAISSTVNLAEDTTVETVKEIYEYAWKMGCKGVTVYREGSREGILLTSREKSAHGEAGATEVAAVPKEMGKPRPRPAVVRGTTQKIETGYGKLYVTINEDENGLFEVFAQ
ncbi:MAG: adenosylcobalamin-dependent ribonucleoside-diphosphate reductase, partial [Thermoplasmata archaeon]